MNHIDYPVKPPHASTPSRRLQRIS